MSSFLKAHWVNFTPVLYILMTRHSCQPFFFIMTRWLYYGYPTGYGWCDHHVLKKNWLKAEWWEYAVIEKKLKSVDAEKEITLQGKESWHYTQVFVWHGPISHTRRRVTTQINLMPRFSAIYRHLYPTDSYTSFLFHVEIFHKWLSLSHHLFVVHIALQHQHYYCYWWWR